MIFSIIVPVYNAELYISECIESVIAQSFADFEVILVDDGSRDRSRSVCEKYTQSDGRFKLYTKENGGVSSARNVGLDYSLGDWIIFLDADDTIHPHMLKYLEEYISANDDVDLIQFAYGRSGFLKSSVDLKGPYVKPLTAYEYYQSGKYNAIVCASVMRGSIIRENFIRFDTKLKLAEDQVFVFQVMCKSNKCSRLPYIFYHYRNNLESATNNPAIASMVQTIQGLERYKSEIPIGREQFDKVIASFIYYMILDESCSKHIIYDIMKYVSVLSMNRCGLKIRIAYYLCKISPRLAVNLIRYLKKVF